MADFNALNAAVTQLKTDADALIALQVGEDPAIQQNINAVTQKINDIDASVKAKLGQ